MPTPKEMSEAELIAAVVGEARAAELPATVDFDALEKLAQGRGGAMARRLLAAVELGRRTVIRETKRVQYKMPADFYSLMRARTDGLDHEEFWVILLDARLGYIDDVRIASGGLTQCSITAREVFAAALLRGAARIATYHNHPSGDCTPSADDHHLWDAVRRAGEVIGIKVIDNFVSSTGGVYSEGYGRVAAPETLLAAEP